MANADRIRGQEIIKRTLKEEIDDAHVQWRDVKGIGEPGDLATALEVSVDGRELWRGKVEFMDQEQIANGNNETLQEVILPIVEHFLDPPKRTGLV